MRIHSCYYRGTLCLLILRCCANRAVHIAGKAVTRLLSRGFPDCLRITAPSDPIRACTIYIYIYLWTSLQHVSDVSKLDTCRNISGCWWQICTVLKTRKFSQSVDKNLFISAQSGSKITDFQSVPKTSSKLIFTLERTCVKNIMFGKLKQKKGSPFLVSGIWSPIFCTCKQGNQANT